MPKQIQNYPSKPRFIKLGMEAALEPKVSAMAKPRLSGMIQHQNNHWHQSPHAMDCLSNQHLALNDVVNKKFLALNHQTKRA